VNLPLPAVKRFKTDQKEIIKTSDNFIKGMKKQFFTPTGEQFVSGTILKALIRSHKIYTAYKVELKLLTLYNYVYSFKIQVSKICQYVNEKYWQTFKSRSPISF
jgi:hypothetical protein